MVDTIIVAISILGTAFIEWIFIYSAKFHSSEKKKWINSTYSIENKYSSSKREHFHAFIWRFIMPLSILIISLSFIYTFLESSDKTLGGIIFHFLLNLIILVIWAFATFLFISSSLEFYLNAKHHKNGFTNKMRNTLKTRLRCTSNGYPSGLSLIIIILALISVIVLGFLKSNILTAISALLWIGLFSQVITLLTPPVILLLANSRDQSLVLQSIVSEYTSATTAISLLDLKEISGYKLARAGGQDVLRASTGEDWKDIIVCFAQIVRIIILDYRVITENVALELSIIEAPQFAAKTLVVLEPRDESQISDSHLYKLIQNGAKSTTPQNLKNLLFDFINPQK